MQYNSPRLPAPRDIELLGEIHYLEQLVERLEENQRATNANFEELVRRLQVIEQRLDDAGIP